MLGYGHICHASQFISFTFVLTLSPISKTAKFNNPFSKEFTK